MQVRMVPQALITEVPNNSLEAVGASSSEARLKKGTVQQAQEEKALADSKHSAYCLR